MGARLVREVYAYAADVPLKPNEFRLLAYMALIAIDPGDPGGRAPRRYFDSRESSALALGRRVPDESGEKADLAERHAAFTAVKEALSGLVKLKSIEREKRGGNGRRAEYSLTLSPTSSRGTEEFRRRRRGRTSLPQKGDGAATADRDSLPLRGRSSLPVGAGIACRLGQEIPTPQEEEDLQEQAGGITSPKPATSLAPVDNSCEAA